jgi:hypothetical protein
MKFKARRPVDSNKITVVPLAPIKCHGNSNSRTTLEEFLKDDSALNKADWKQTSSGNFYFDCSKYKKDFKLDPKKIE